MYPRKNSGSIDITPKWRLMEDDVLFHTQLIFRVDLALPFKCGNSRQRVARDIMESSKKDIWRHI